MGLAPENVPSYATAGGGTRAHLPRSPAAPAPASPAADTPLATVPIPEPSRPFVGIPPSPQPPSLSLAATNVGFHLTEAAKATFSALPAPAPPRRSLSIQSALALLTGASKDLNPTTTAGPTSALPVPRLLVAGVLVVGGLSAGGLGRWVALAGGLLGASAIWTYLQRAPGGNAFVGPQTSAWRPSIATRIVKP